MPRSSRGASGHRGHRSRRRQGSQSVASVAPQPSVPDSATAAVTPATPTDTETPSPVASQAPASPPRRTPAPQSPGTTVSGASVHGDPLLNKELVRIAAFAVFIAILLVVLTTVLGD